MKPIVSGLIFGPLTWGVLIGIALLLGACAPTLTPLGIASDLDASLRTTHETATLPLRCEAVYRAEERCVAAGFPKDCAWTTWVERDHDMTVRMCLARAR